ncbi:RNA-directed DNA polymerase [Paraburkholderia sp. 31.1]|uniref:RNA-directed DNA polymerase n=1 Tax=Paraburkholderia sp. 31.1 TaxID=2615205 RepID=UPI00165523EE|nr:RNA-directed DNA polymerase [Paraburkholderia sp. 31.1]MBC8726110.1 RNA-directed DNA polymerase [Paraburkholderia sp. 31.1]
MDRTARLLERGYFPSQLPPSFTTVDLANHHAMLYAQWVALQPVPKKGPKIPRSPSGKAELFSVARAGHQRRVTSITNPVAQTYLSTHVTEHWGDLLKHYRQSRLSASRPRFLHGAARGANIPSMQFLYNRKVMESAGYRFMLRTDISRFFPTIYTHSVPWALHGKAVAKRNRSVTPKFFGNLLDLSLRQAQDEQTFGLPIGPDTSHVIAEAIATAVDLELKKRLKSFPAGFRYVDDYFMFFATAREAEAALAALIRALKEYELQVNFEKTKTCTVLEITDDFWSHRLRNFSISKNGTRQASDFSHFFELAKELARLNADESVMIYALKKASSVIVRKQNWDRFEAHVCQVAMGYPNTLQTVARLFSTYKSVGYSIGKIRLSRFINAVIEDHAPLGHHSEVAWCLWMAKDLDLTVSDANVDVISEMHSSVCALILLDLHSMGKLGRTPKTAYWKVHEKSTALYDDMWLLSYEAGVRGWGGFANAHITADPHFERLLALNVHFYDTGAVLPPLFKLKHGALVGKRFSNIVDLFELEDVEDYLDYEEGDGSYEGVVFSYDGDTELDEPEAEEESDEGDDPNDMDLPY